MECVNPFVSHSVGTGAWTCLSRLQVHPIWVLDPKSCKSSDLLLCKLNFTKRFTKGLGIEGQSLLVSKGLPPKFLAKRRRVLLFLQESSGLVACRGPEREGAGSGASLLWTGPSTVVSVVAMEAFERLL